MHVYLLSLLNELECIGCYEKATLFFLTTGFSNLFFDLFLPTSSLNLNLSMVYLVWS